MADNTDANAYTKYGGSTGGNGLSAFLNTVLPAYAAAFPNARAALLANGLNQAHNIYAYNRQQQKDQSQQEANDSSIAKRRTGMDITGKFDHSLFDASAGDMRKDNAVPSMQALLNGDPLTLAPQADYPADLVSKTLEQQGKATNYANSTGAGIGSIAAGQGASTIGGMIPGAPTVGQVVNTPGGQMAMDPGNQPLTAGASYQAPPPALPNVSPYTLPTDIPTQVADLMKSGLTDKQKAGELGQKTQNEAAIRAQEAKKILETLRHNKADEGIGQANAQAHMIEARKPPAFNLDSQLWNAANPTQRQNMIDSKGQKGTPSDHATIINEAMKSLLVPQSIENGDGKPKVMMMPPQPGSPNFEQYSILQAKRNDIIRQGTSGAAPFGNKAQSNLKASSNGITGQYGTYKF